MKKNLKKKIRSKRGMSLVELVVGITLVVIVFASTLGALVGGYTTTIYNSDQTRVAALNASLNERIICTIRNYGTINDSTISRLIGDSNAPLQKAMNDVIQSGEIGGVANVTYVSPDNFTDPVSPEAAAHGTSKSIRYTLVPSVESTVTGNGGSANIKGVWIRTCFDSAAGTVFFESFVPYTE